MKMKNMHLCQLNLRNFMRIKKIEENERQVYKIPKVTYNEFENALECDPGKRSQIWQYPPN